MRTVTCLATVAAALLAVPASAQVINGGFEAGNVGFTSGYNYVATPGPFAMYPEGSYTVGANAADYHNLWASVGAHTGSNYLIGNGAPGANVAVWQQAIAGLVAGRSYGFSAYVTSVCCNAAFGGSNGVPVLDAAANGTAFTSVSAIGTGVWTKLSGSFVATGPVTTLSIFNDNSVASGNDFGLDDISVTSAVPEPGAWALMIAGIGLVGATLRRRVARVAYAM